MADRCKPDELAVVIRAQNKGNLGRIVKVLALHDRTGPLVYDPDITVWMTESAEPMMWTIEPKVYMQNFGPIPDSQLQPIRGQPAPKRKRARRTKVLEAA
jgi:hypothetical protein